MTVPTQSARTPGGPSKSGAHGSSFIDPAALMRIKNLELRAKLVVDGFLSGLHKSPVHGFSVEFTEYRQYSPGDDLRFLDWRLYARSDRYYIKRFEDETNLRCYLLVDLSRSMGYKSLAYDKAEYARTAAATIAYFLTLQRDAVGLVAFDEAIREYLPARFRPGHLHRLMLLLENSPAGTATNLGAALEQVCRTSRKRGLVVLLSDLLAPVETLERQLGQLRSQGHEVVVLRILDPAEVNFEFRQESLFFDLETGRELYVDPLAVRQQYRERFAEHSRAMQRVFSDLGLDYYELTTDRPLENALFDLLNARLRRGRQFARRRPAQPRGGSVNMGWLVPLYLAGLAALSLPLLFHLVRRTPRGRQEFSSLMFLSPTPPRLTRRSRLDQLLLLSLRLLALAILTIAFTRPFLRETAAFSPLDLPGRRVAVLVDTSASMRRADLWQQAVRTAEQQLDQLNPQDDVALYGFHDRLERLIDFETDGAPTVAAKVELVRQQLKLLEPGWGGTDLGTALVSVAGEMDSASDVQQAIRVPLLVVISDFQKGARIEALQAFEWPKHVSVVMKPVTAAKRTNTVAHILPDEEDRGDADVRVRVVNAADSTTDQFHLSWAADPARALRTTEVAVYVPAGQSRVVRLPRTADSLEADRILLRGDDHPFDNTFFVVPPRKQQATVLYSGTDLDDDVHGMQYYLRLAVTNDPLRQIDVKTVDVAKPQTALADAAARLVVLTQPAGADLQPTLRAFVEAGGTLLFVPASHEAALTLPVFFDDVEVQATPQQSGNDYLLLGNIDFTHPLFAPFAGPRYGDFTKIHFWKHQTVKLSTPATTRVVARYDNSTPALLERFLGKGRALALTSGWNPEDSQFALSSKFVPFVASLLDLACGEAQTSVSASIHESVSLPVPTDGGATVVRPPGGKPVTLAAGVSSFAATDQPGIYTARSGTVETRFAVNLATAESNTAPLELEQLEQRGVKLGNAASRSERIDRLRQERDIELEGRQKVWRWLIAAAVGVLLLETWLAGRAEGKIRKESAITVA